MFFCLQLREILFHRLEDVVSNTRVTGAVPRILPDYISTALRWVSEHADSLIRIHCLVSDQLSALVVSRCDLVVYDVVTSRSRRLSQMTA